MELQQLATFQHELYKFIVACDFKWDIHAYHLSIIYISTYILVTFWCCDKSS